VIHDSSDRGGGIQPFCAEMDERPFRALGKFAVVRIGDVWHASVAAPSQQILNKAYCYFVRIVLHNWLHSGIPVIQTIYAFNARFSHMRSLDFEVVYPESQQRLGTQRLQEEIMEAESND
jgi:hypothetical protein